MNKSRLIEMLSSFSHFAVIAGIIFAIFQYLDRKAEIKEQTAIAYLQNFQRPDLIDARFRLDAYWIDKPLIALKQVPGSDGVIDTLALEMIFPPNEKPNYNDLLRIVEQLDVISACSISGVCKESIIIDQLGPYIRSFHCRYKAPLKRLQSTYSYKGLGDLSKKIVGSENICK